MKVNSPRQVALYSALLAAIVVGLATYLTESISSDVYLIPLLVSLVTLAVTYGLVYVLIERFLYSKIKMIYKNILNIKTQKSQDIKVQMNEDVLGAVSEEVESWAAHKKDEIEQLRSQEKFRREFLGNLAHELKTPIFSIQGYILTLLEGGMDDPNVNKDFLLRAAKGVDRMTHIVEDLDMIMKFESGRIPLDVKKHDIVELIEEIIESAEYKAKKRGVKVFLKGNVSGPINVMMDRARIGQVLTNLINNAINYASEEGGEVEIRCYKMNEDYLIEVADNGIGIAEEHLPRLFERFYRVDKSRSRNMGGTGLGLAIVKHIVEAHGKSIDVRSTEGIGSTFSFTLSAAK